jgi:O-antigen/teichoic acid export membrane protein
VVVSEGPPVRFRLAAWNYATLAAFTVTTMLLGLVITPPLVRLLGDERYGASRMVVDYQGYLALLELGLGGALAPLLASAAARGDDHALRATLAAGLRAYLGVALAIVAAGLLLLPWAPRLVPVATALRGDLRGAWVAVALSYGLIVLSPLRSLLEADQRGYRVNLILTGQAVLTAVASLGLASRGWGITGQATALLLGNLAGGLLLAFDGFRRQPGALQAAFREPSDPKARAALWRLGGPSLALNLCGRVSLLTDYIVVGLILGPEAVTPLFLTQRLPALVQPQLLGIGNAAWAGLAQIHSRGELDLFRRRLLEVTALIAVLGAAALGPIVAYNHHFYKLWMSHETYLAGVAPVAAANALLLGLFSFWCWCVVGTGRVRQAVAPTAASAAVNLCASIALTWYLGAIGPLLGTLVAHLTVSLWALPALLRKLFGVEPLALLIAAGRPLAWGVPYAAGLWWLAHAHTPAGWPGLIAEMGVAALGFLGLAWLVVLSPEERIVWRERLGSLLGWHRNA